MMRWILIPISLITTTLWAETPMTANQFDTYTQGKTLFFAQRGETYGAERYLPGNRVQWTFLDGQCKEGEWYVQDSAICFVYEDEPLPQCWYFYEGNGGLRAEFLGDGDRLELYEAQDLDQEMLCLGPEVGV